MKSILLQTKQFVLLLCALQFLSLIVVFFIVLITTAQQKHGLADNIAVELRGGVIVGDYREVELKIKPRLEGGFTQIQISTGADAKYISYGRVHNKTVYDRLLYGKITIPIFFDANKSQIDALIIFRYLRCENWYLVFIIWLPLTVLLSWLLFFIKIHVQKLFLQEAELQKNKAIAQTIQMLAHDVRKPFTIAKAGLAGLKEVKTISVMHSRAAILLQEVDQSFLQVEGMLEDIMESGRVRIPILEETSLENLIQSTVKEVFQINSSARVDIKYALNHTKQANIEGKQIARVLSNIVNNGVQAMQGKGTLYFTTEDLYKNGNFLVHMSIANDGPIISQETIKQLFEQSFSTGKKGGTGLGLWISKKIVNSHGGEIWCESPGKNSKVEFHFTLPVMEKEKAPLSGILPLSSEEALEMIANARDFDMANTHDNCIQDSTIIEYETIIANYLQSKSIIFKILLLDDEDFYRDSVKDLIREDSLIKDLISFWDKKNPDGIADFVSSENPDLCIFDIDLGASQNGFDVTKLIRDNGYKGKICIYSNRAFKEDLAIISALGADTFCPKPMAREYLLKLIASTLGIEFANSASETKLESSNEVVIDKKLPIIIYVEDSLTFRLTCQSAMIDAQVILFSHPEALLEAINNNPNLLPSATAILLDNYYGELSKLSGIEFGKILKNKYGVKIPLILFSDGKFKADELIGSVDGVLCKEVKTLACMMAELPKPILRF